MTDHMRARREGRQGEQNRQADPQLEGELAVLGDVVHPPPDSGALQMAHDHKQHGRAGQHRQRAKGRASGMFGIDGHDSATVHAASAIATWGIICSTGLPPRPNESTIGKVNAADDEPSSTAYKAA
jgi:hypothetical protein